jgi:hypothetical protein
MKKTLNRKNVVILINEKRDIECWGSLKLACKAHPEFVYNTLTKRKLPVIVNGWIINRVPFNKEL